MRDVLRWSPIMTPSPEGTFVSNHDYAMLQEECERLRAALAAREADGGNGACPHCLPIVGAELAKRCAAAILSATDDEGRKDE